MQISQEFNPGDQEALQSFILDRDSEEKLVIVAGNPRVTSIQPTESFLVDNSQHTAVFTALKLYNYAVIQSVLKELESVGPKRTLVEALVRVDNWPAFVRGGEGRKPFFPRNLVVNRGLKKGVPDFLPHFAQLVKRAKDNIRIVTQLDHDGGSSVHKFLTKNAEAFFRGNSGGTRSGLKRSIEKGEVDVSDFKLKTFLPALKQGVFSPGLEGSLAHAADIVVLPEGLIRGFMNQLAADNDWGEEVNYTLKKDGQSREPYCLLRNIYSTRLDDSLKVVNDDFDLVVNCPGVVAGTLGLISRDILNTPNGGRGKILAIKERDGRRVNKEEENGGTQFYNERMPRSNLAPAKFMLTPLVDPKLVEFASFDDPNRCR